MKKLIVAITLILIMHHLKNLQGYSVESVSNVNSEKVDEIKKLTRVLKHQYKLHCELCKTGKNPKFMRQSPGEFQYRFERSRDNIEKTIEKVSMAYARLGVPTQKIAEQAKQLRDGIYNWV